MRKHFLSVSSCLAAMFLGAGLAQSSEPIKIANPWVRAMPENAKVSAAYMHLRNTTGEADRLLSAETPCSERVELHHVREEAGKKTMYPVPHIKLPAQGDVFLKPGDYHLMLMEPKKSLAMGKTCAITLHFQQAGKLTVYAPVKEPPADDSSPEQHAQHH